ncbi:MULTISPECIES: hypothetical protein [unclassified Nonomuraea]|uniref:hypothetical protein n=1 Tax=unclassified Nonomuraea TaxID=2593643 RepID=UPI00340445D1
MNEHVQYYAMVLLDGPDSPESPGGLARRRVLENGTQVDEALHRDLQWHPTREIKHWEVGNAVGDLVEISQAQAEKVIASFQQKFGPKAP